MTKSLTLFLMCLALSVTGWAQNFQFEETATDKDGIRSLVDRVNVAHALQSRDATCGEDTVFYTDAKRTSGFVSLITLRNDPSSLSRAAQWFEVPAGDSIAVSGFIFSANVEKDGNVNDTISVVASLYSSTADSLPDALLATTTVDVDTTGQSGLGPEYTAVFPSVVTIPGNFVLVLENPDTARLTVISNSVSESHGAGEFLASGGTPTNWFRGYQIGFGGGLVLDADWEFFPFVTYNISTDFESDSCLVFNGSSAFSSATSGIASSRFYNLLTFLDVFTGRPDSTFAWDFDGDGNFDDFGADVSYSFPPTSSSYDVELATLIFGWAVQPLCVDQAVKSLPAGLEVAAGFTTTYDQGSQTATFLNASQAAETYEWHFGDGTTSTDANPTHQYVDTAGFFVVTLISSRASACASSDTARDTIEVWAVGIQDDLLDQQVNVYPNPSNDNFMVEIGLDRAEFVTIEVRNIVGQLVAQAEPGKITQENLTLNMSNQKAGIYFMTLRADGRQITRKLTKY